MEKQLGYFKSRDKINMGTRIITLIPNQILSLVSMCLVTINNTKQHGNNNYNIDTSDEHGIH